MQKEKQLFPVFPLEIIQHICRCSTSLSAIAKISLLNWNCHKIVKELELLEKWKSEIKDLYGMSAASIANKMRRVRSINQLEYFGAFYKIYGKLIDIGPIFIAICRTCDANFVSYAYQLCSEGITCVRYVDNVAHYYGHRSTSNWLFEKRSSHNSNLKNVPYWKFEYETLCHILKFLCLRDMAALSLVSYGFYNVIKKDSYYAHCKMAYLRYKDTEKKINFADSIPDLMNFPTSTHFNHFFLQDLEWRRFDCSTILWNACIYGHLDIVKLIYRYNPEPEHKHKLKHKPKHKPAIRIVGIEVLLFVTACTNGHLDIAKFIYYRRPNILMDKNYLKALIEASKNGHLKIVEWLLHICPQIFHHHTELKYAFQLARKNGYDEVARCLAYLVPQLMLTFDNINS